MTNFDQQTISESLDNVKFSSSNTDAIAALAASYRTFTKVVYTTEMINFEYSKSIHVM